MRRSRRFGEAWPRVARALHGEHGAAALELVTAGFILLLPLVYLVLVLSALQSATLAAEGAARHAARVFVLSPDGTEAQRAADRAIDVTLRDYDVSADAVLARIDCRPAPADCLARGGEVTVRIEVQVPLPLAPPVIDRGASSMTVTASATQRVSRFWMTP